jgi:hypothetical protein
LQGLQLASFVGAAHNTIVADAHKTQRQDVLSEPSGKLLVAECHRLCMAAIAVVFIGEANLLLINLHDAMIADRHFVGIAAQVFNHLLCKGLTESETTYVDPEGLEPPTPISNQEFASIAESSTSTFVVL